MNMKLLSFFLLSSKYWSLIGTCEQVSCLNANSHHTTHVIYGFENTRLLALVTFKFPKTHSDVLQLYGNVFAEPQPNSKRLNIDRVSFHKIFMSSNFNTTTEII